MSSILPKLALSVRQPWTWAIAAGHKPVENRSWRAPNSALRYRGPVAIHAARGMTRDEYEDAADFMRSIGVECPPAADLQRGGIVAIAIVTDIVKSMDSPWFFGPRGLVLDDVRPIDFIPCAGQLGFFEWRRDDTLAPPAPARWMMPRQRVQADIPDLFMKGSGHG
ncbi:ASCH domain-containing protein [Shinella pollutisoli]|uniref:ASCH domain-containing protein n=1 Tax=Shinella pollutisoli TaxID=2250594 RepID=A0ABV7DJ35_9HYPH|nr:ASCH domain-containing protein [Shinella pollutisoli]